MEKITNHRCFFCGEEMVGNKKKKYCSSACKHKTHKSRNIEFVLNYKKDKSCRKCGFNKNPEILQFHHKKSSKENIWITDLVRNSRSIDRIKEEIKKCELLCPNCHMWLHFKKSKNTSQSLTRYLQGEGSILTNTLNPPTPLLIKSKGGKIWKHK